MRASLWQQWQEQATLHSDIVSSSHEDLISTILNLSMKNHINMKETRAILTLEYICNRVIKNRSYTRKGGIDNGGIAAVLKEIRRQPRKAETVTIVKGFSL